MLGERVLACDLDPQANLPAAFLREQELEQIWRKNHQPRPRPIYQCVRPLTEVGDLVAARLVEIAPNLKLVPGDLMLSRSEDTLSSEWPMAMGSANRYRPFRILTAFSTIVQDGASEMDATIILADLGPNLGAINRSAMSAIDHVIVPLGADIFFYRAFATLDLLWGNGVEIGIG